MKKEDRQIVWIYPDSGNSCGFKPSAKVYEARIAELQKELNIVQESERAEAQEADRLRAEVKELKAHNEVLQRRVEEFSIELLDYNMKENKDVLERLKQAESKIIAKCNELLKERKGLTMNNDTKLKPCPFCGGTELYYFKGELYVLECAHCGARLGDYRTREEVAEAWNARKEETFTKAEARTILNLLMLDRTGESVYESIIAKCEQILARKD